MPLDKPKVMLLTRCFRSQTVHPINGSCAMMLSRVVILLLVWRSSAAATNAALTSAAESAQSSNYIHNVLPPLPDDHTPVCTPNASLHSLCGPERYCTNFTPAEDSSSSSTTATHKHRLVEASSSLTCVHKTLLYSPLSIRDILTWLFTCGCCLLASMAGIGGGGLLLPLAILCLNFTPKEASVLSNTGVFCNCLGQLFVNTYFGRQSNRQENNNNNYNNQVPVIIGTVLMVMPGLIAGGGIAITLEGLVPSTVILLLALVTLCLACWKTWKKAQKMSKDEREASNSGNSSDNQATLSSTDDEEQPNEEEEKEEEEEKRNFVAQDQLAAIGNINQPVSALEEEEDEVDESQYSAGERSSMIACFVDRFYGLVILIALCWILDATTFVILRGNVIRRCSSLFFIVIALPVLFAILFITLGRVLLFDKMRRAAINAASRILQDNNNDVTRRLLEQEEQNNITYTHNNNSSNSNDHDKADGDDENMLLDSNNLSDVTAGHGDYVFLAWWLPYVSVFIGLLSALLGIGGGELLGPILLLLLNMKPQKSTTITGLMSFLNSGTNFIHYAIANMIISPGYSILLMGSAGFLGGSCGRYLAFQISRRGGGQAIFAYSLCVVLGVATCLVLFELVTTKPSWESQSLC